MDKPTILTITPNAAQDRVYLIDDFALGKIHRPTKLWTFAGGKGVNVGRAFTRLGGRAICTGFLAGEVGKQARIQLLNEGLGDEFITIAGESRLCMQFCDTLNERITEVNEPGPAVTQADVDALTDRICHLAPGVAAVSLSGRSVPGAPETAYADWIGAARKSSVCMALDTSGKPLAMGVAAGTDVLKINVLEFGELLGIPDLTPEGVPEQLRKHTADLPSTVVITCGADGAFGAVEDCVFHACCTADAFRSAVGSGDAFMGGVLWARLTGMEFREQLSWGVAAAAANLETFCACDITSESVERALTRVRLTAV